MDLEDVAKELLSSGLSDEVQLMRKKIQLSEGQRRAEYEEFEAEKKRLAGRIRNLKKDLRESQTSKPSKFVDLELLRCSGRPTKELQTYLGKTPEEVEQILDLQCMDLKKKLDLLRYEIDKKKQRLENCIREMNQLKSENDSEETVTLLQPNEIVSKLENKIQETELHLQEMRHIEKKYSKMRQSLLEDRVFFQSTLDKYEEEIDSQAREIRHLQDVRDEAVRLRDKTRRKLSKLEAMVMTQGVEREQQLREMKWRVEETRQELERTERALMPTSGKGTHGDSGEEEETGLSTEEMAKEHLLEKMRRLKEVTGAKDEEDIIQKLKTQQATKERLLKLKVNIENDKKKAEMNKEQLEAELEAVKFKEVKEKEQNEEEVEILEREIAKVEEEVKVQTQILNIEQAKLEEFQNNIAYLVKLLRVVSGEQVKQTIYNEINYYDLAKEFQSRFSDVLDHIKETELSSDTLMETQTDDLIVKELEKLEISSKKQDGEADKPTEEAPDVPTRDLLKRQSQIVVEAQGKKKGGYQKDNISQTFR